MSSTKIVIIVLVLVALLFIVFVVRGGLRDEPKQPKSDRTTATKTKPPSWTNTIKGLFSSLKPGLTLKQKFYSSITEEPVPPDPKQAFRTATFLLRSGRPVITYLDKTPIEPGSQLKKDLENPQVCRLADFDNSNPRRCSIIAFKLGGTLNFACEDESGCRVEVE